MHKRMEMAELHKIQTDPGTQFSDGQDTKFVNQNTLAEKKLNLQNIASKDTTLRSTQVFSTLPYTNGENEKLEIWKYFFWKKLEKMEIFM